MEDEVFALFGFVVAIIVGIWVHKDAKKRGKSSGVALFWAIAVIVFPILFLPLWLALRPEKINISGENPALCKSCGKYYDGLPEFCPNCGKKI